MSETNKTYRIKTEVDTNVNDKFITLDTNLFQDYQVFDILSVKLTSTDIYKLHNSNYGVVVGRVLANNGFGVPNAKLSIFIEADSEDGDKMKELYPFINSYSSNVNGIAYNLLPDEKVADCHQSVGTFPNKRYLLDNDVIIEVFDKYYKYTTKTNNSGDYLIMGVPVGNHILHMDLDLSDCGILSQRPRDFVYKGYTIEQFENPNMFKTSDNFNELSQIFTQNQTITVHPFWGDTNNGEQVGITRVDLNVAFTFQPTCVFMGCVASDKSSQGITKKCMATENMGNMEEMTTGEGTIEMIRKTPSGEIEEFQIRGTQLINANGVWCYQIPMNLDYMMTDEYGNMVPTDDPSKGIPTRCSVRFRISMQDNEENVDNFFRAKVLVPHNPQNTLNGKHEEYDYEFGSYTRDDSFRDLFWNNVYTVKSYIPRFQKRHIRAWKENKFTGIKNCNFFGGNNPIPYNNIRIKLPLMFTIMCAIIKCFIFITGIFNYFISMFGFFLADFGNTHIPIAGYPFKKLYDKALTLKLNVLSEGLCPDLENWFFSPIIKSSFLRTPHPPRGRERYNLIKQTSKDLITEKGFQDPQSIDLNNGESDEDVICLTTKVDYLISCIEMNLAMEYKVINFDFYNDWINGLIYIPRFMRYVRPKKTFLGITFAKTKVKGCMDDSKIFAKTRRYTQQCAIPYSNKNVNGAVIYANVKNPLSSGKSKRKIKAANNLHKGKGLFQKTIFGKNGGVCHEHTTTRGHNVYYMKPCEWVNNGAQTNAKANLFATDLILLGSLNDCDSNGLPQSFKYLSSTSYIMPTNLALTNMETNGPLYANSKDTICTGNGGQLPDGNNLDKDEGIKVIPVEDGLSGEIKFYKNSGDANIDTTYDGGELSDIIALTEAAGIAWNYTGPGQGVKSESEMYYPGGHFLGMSCANSETNIKSCINLERICEVGANLSQRKEEVRGVTEDGKLLYTYIAPTGFISGNDIIAEDFRSMFSTMNQKRLIANKVNPLTGYKMYDFQYSHPINFDGSFKNVVKGNNSYNTNINLPDEDNKVFRESGIEINNSKRPDYDSKETVNTITKTVEDSSLDYYLFRFGLKREDCKKNNEIQLRKFLLNKGNNYYLPQYENSYYFYFGMKDGASAIDEFNKQFFSVCDTESINIGDPKLSVNRKELHLCQGREDVEIIIENLEPPYSQLYYTVEGDTNNIDNSYELNKYEILGNLSNEKGVYKPLSVEGNEFSTIIRVNGLKFGNYTFTIVDSEGILLSKSVKVGGNIMTANIKVYDFNVSDYKRLSRSKEGEVSNINNDDILGASISTKVTNKTDETILRAYCERDSCIKVYACITDNPEPCLDDMSDCGAYIPCVLDSICGNNLCLYDGLCKNVSPEDFPDFCKTKTCYDDFIDLKPLPCPSYNICEYNPSHILPPSNCPLVDSDVITEVTNHLFEGGYVKIEDLIINENYNSLIKQVKGVVVGVNENVEIGQGESEIFVYDVVNKKYNPIEIPIITGNVIYDIYLGYSCESGNTDNWNYVYQTSYMIKDGSYISLNMGWKNMGIYIPISNESEHLRYGDDTWWYAIDSGNTPLEWVKKICNFKETTPEDTFSNNIFAINGEKIVWGTPQNSEGVYPKWPNVFNTEEEIEDGYTLDDEFSYYSTYPSTNGNKHYSAIAVDGTSVGGDFWAILSGGTVRWINREYKNGVVVTDNESGVTFPMYSGYVFKPLPDGDLQYHVYKGTLEFDLDENGNAIENGLFYPAFIYPVVSYPFKLDINFYVWDNYFVSEKTTGDGLIYDNETFAGRTEMTLTNGISFKDENNNYTFKDLIISNINRNDLRNSLNITLKQSPDNNIFKISEDDIPNYRRILSFTGMNPHIIEETVEDSNGYDEVIINDFKTAIETYNNIKYAIGERNINEMSYSYIGGIPNSMKAEDGSIVDSSMLESLVTNVSDSFDINNIFSKKITYKKTKGKNSNKVFDGYSFYRGDSKTPYNFSNNNVKTRLFICKVKDSELVVNGAGNHQYIYHKTGYKQPVYWVLCKYNDFAYNNEKGEYVLLYINYYQNDELEWSLPYINNQGESINQIGKLEDVKSIRDNLHEIITLILRKKDKAGEVLKADPITTKMIIVKDNKSWANLIDNENLKLNEGTVNEIPYSELSDNEMFYGVEIYQDKTNNNTINLFKIFPNITEVEQFYENGNISNSSFIIDFNNTNNKTESRVFSVKLIGENDTYSYFGYEEEKIKKSQSDNTSSEIVRIETQLPFNAIEGDSEVNKEIFSSEILSDEINLGNDETVKNIPLSIKVVSTTTQNIWNREDETILEGVEYTFYLKIDAVSGKGDYFNNFYFYTRNYDNGIPISITVIDKK